VKTIIGSIIGILAIIASFFGAYCYIDNWKANAVEFKNLKQEVEYDRSNYQLDSVQGRINKLEQEYEGKTMPKSIKENYQELKERAEKLKTKLKKMEEK
jgi:archaellum component FlaC